MTHHLAALRSVRVQVYCCDLLLGCVYTAKIQSTGAFFPLSVYRTPADDFEIAKVVVDMQHIRRYISSYAWVFLFFKHLRLLCTGNVGGSSLDRFAKFLSIRL